MRGSLSLSLAIVCDRVGDSAALGVVQSARSTGKGSDRTSFGLRNQLRRESMKKSSRFYDFVAMSIFHFMLW